MSEEEIRVRGQRLRLPLERRSTGAYVMQLSSNGASSAVVQPGDSILLQVELSSDNSDEHSSAIFRMLFSAPGLKYLGYEWAAPYLNGTLDDDSKPLANVLPLLLDDGTLSGVGYPAGDVDIEFSNVLPVGQNFGWSLLLSLELEDPDNYSGPDEIEISLIPASSRGAGQHPLVSRSGDFIFSGLNLVGAC